MALCAGSSPVTGEFPSQRAETRSYFLWSASEQTIEWEAGDLRRHRAHYDVSVMYCQKFAMQKLSKSTLCDRNISLRNFPLMVPQSLRNIWKAYNDTLFVMKNDFGHKRGDSSMILMRVGYFFLYLVRFILLLFLLFLIEPSRRPIPRNPRGGLFPR